MSEEMAAHPAMQNSDPIRVAYLAGTSHCGSTLLALLMNSHPQVASVGEVSPSLAIQRRDELGFDCSCGQKVDACPFWQAVARKVNSQGVPFSTQNWTNDYQYKLGMLGKTVREYSFHPLLQHAQRLAIRLPLYRRKIARTDRANRAFMRAILEQTGAGLFFDTTKLLLRLKHLLQVEGLDVRVVRMIRDVRAFAVSMRRKGYTLQRAAEHWKQFHLSADRLFKSHPHLKVFELRYEDLCSEPDSSLDRLGRFLDVGPFSPSRFIDPGEHHVLGNSMRLRGPLEVRLDEKWRTELHEDEQKAVVEVAGQTHRRLGYPDHVSVS